MSRRRIGALRVFRRAVVAAVVLLGCASCTELQRVPHLDVNAQQLVGHAIRVTTIDGQVYEIRLLEITEDALVSEFQRIPFDKIALVERRNISFWRTVGCVGGGALVGALAALGVLLLVMIQGFNP